MDDTETSAVLVEGKFAGMNEHSVIRRFIFYFREKSNYKCFRESIHIS